MTTSERLAALSGQRCLPVCMYCSRIRALDGVWFEVEEEARADLTESVTHGICTVCYEEQVLPRLKSLKQDEHSAAG